MGSRLSIIEEEFEDIVTAVEAIDEPAPLLGSASGGRFALEAARSLDDLPSLGLSDPAFSGDGHECDAVGFFDQYEAVPDIGERERALERFYRAVPELPSAQIRALRSAPTSRFA